MTSPTPSAAGNLFRDLGKSGVVPFVAGNVVLGTIGVFVHYAGSSPLTATWFRCAFGLVGLTIWLLVRKQAHVIRLNRAVGPWLLVAATLMVMAWALFFSAIERISTGEAIVMFHLQPMWVLVLGRVWLGEKVGRGRCIAVGVAMIGLVFATGLAEHLPWLDKGGGFGARYWMSVAFCLVGALCTACVTIIAHKLRDTPSGALAWWQCLIGTAVLWVWPAHDGWPAFGSSWAWLAGVGLIHTGLAYTLIYTGMARLPTSRIAILQFVYPAVAIAVDRFWFGQQLSALQLAGVLIMSVAIWRAEKQPHG